MTSPERSSVRLRIALYALPLAAGVGLAVRSAWVCDDSFISFRYVDQLAAGHGLVYNAGERVEGYTHFLWVVLLAALHRVGVDLVILGRYLPIVFFAGLLVALLVHAMRTPGARLPLAAWCVALHADMLAFASSGLESAPYALAVLLAALATAATPLHVDRVAAAAALTTLFRPEGLVVSAVLGGFCVLRGAGPRALGRGVLVWLALVAPLFVWRLIYYGDWLPNSVHAKSALGGYWDQGLRYARLFYQIHPILLFATLVALIAVVEAVRRRRIAPVTVFAILSLVLLLGVLHVGGDFMHARFFVPIIPLLYLVLEEKLRGAGLRLAVAGTVVAVAATLFARVPHQNLLGTGVMVDDIVDERVVYTREAIDKRRRQGAQLRTDLAGTDARIAIHGGQASLAYFANPGYVLEHYGLTDREIARRRVWPRGRPGHEKVATEDDMLARRVHFYFTASTDSAPGALNEVYFHDLRCLLIAYERAVMDSVRGRPGVRIEDVPRRIDSFPASLYRLQPSELRDLWTWSVKTYFAFNDDPERFEVTREAFRDAGLPASVLESTDSLQAAVRGTR